MTKMPVLFAGHGSPMNALADNSYSQTLARLGGKVPRPRAVVCISAHWVTVGAAVTAAERPQTIHDFYGFPQPLFELNYPCPGSPSTAARVCELVSAVPVRKDTQRGLDHGCWSVLRHMYPSAEVPVIQLSLDTSQPPEHHYKIGQQLAPLREEGVLLLGSGNIVHNLQQIRWQAEAPDFDWAEEFDRWVKEKVEKRAHSALMVEALKTPAGLLSNPSPEHYYPLLYILGASGPDDAIANEFEEIQNSSISMRSFSFGL